MIRIRLFHWNAIEAVQKASMLESMGYVVDYEPLAPQALKKLRNNPPAIVIIDMSRRPSQGRDIAINIRHTKTTRNVPIVFVDGDQQKVNQVKTYVPDAIYTDYAQIQEALKEASAHPPKVTVIPKSIFEPYRQASLTKKLGIKSNTTLVLIDPPEDFAKTLGELPPNVLVQKQLSDQSDLIILFVRTQQDLQNRLVEIVNKFQPDEKVWIAWQKKSFRTATDATQTTVREVGLAQGLVDYKICRIDETWTGLLFTRRKPKS